MSPPRQLAESLLAECDALEAEVVRLNKENDRLLDDAEIIDDIVALQKVEIEALKRLIADNARDESGRVSMPLAGLRKLEEARERAEQAEKVALAFGEALAALSPHLSKGEPEGPERFSAHRMAMRGVEVALAATPADLASKYIERSKVEALAFAASGAEEFLQKQFSSLSMAGVKWNHPGAQKAYAALDAALAAAEVKP